MGIITYVFKWLYFTQCKDKETQMVNTLSSSRIEGEIYYSSFGLKSVMQRFYKPLEHFPLLELNVFFLCIGANNWKILYTFKGERYRFLKNY